MPNNARPAASNMMDDYIDVAERLREFHEQFPDGTLQQVGLQFLEFAGNCWVVYSAAAYRHPDDPRPGIGTAWEPVPGRTNFTRDSEVQNAETAAWGRALVALGTTGTKRIASRQEVERSRATQDAIAANPNWESMNSVKREINRRMPGAGPGQIIAAITASIGKPQEDWTLADLETFRDGITEPD